MWITGVLYFRKIALKTKFHYNNTIVALVKIKCNKL